MRGLLIVVLALDSGVDRVAHAPNPRECHF